MVIKVQSRTALRFNSENEITTTQHNLNVFGQKVPTVRHKSPRANAARFKPEASSSSSFVWVCLLCQVRRLDHWVKPRVKRVMIRKPKQKPNVNICLLSFDGVSSNKTSQFVSLLISSSRLLLWHLLHSRWFYARRNSSQNQQSTSTPIPEGLTTKSTEKKMTTASGSSWKRTNSSTTRRQVRITN